ncbi:hypothetical protein [Burkholderia sp. TSV86]|uniref:hypothetical protein n=1 Tax=Burkholderia sp. TSV86 TaxID=1385594 RepID=UPI0018D22BC6|nr:hypothetical protein [Burkholderia sp. TSV86]
MKSEVIASAMKTVPAVGSNFWLWLTSHDINWYVAVAMYTKRGRRFADPCETRADV